MSVYGASQSYIASLCLDLDPVRIQFGIPAECLLYFALDFGGWKLRLQYDQVAHTLDPADAPYRLRGPLARIVPLDFAFECEHALLDNHLDVFGRVRQFRP